MYMDEALWAVGLTDSSLRFSSSAFGGTHMHIAAEMETQFHIGTHQWQAAGGAVVGEEILSPESGEGQWF